VKVLVADDDLGSRLVAQAAVQALGHECVAVPDGDAAWRHVQDFRPDVLVTDRDMPGLDGVQLCRAIRESEQDSYTYLILVTSAANRADVLSGMEAGADDYLAKPLDPFDLETRLLAARRVTSLHTELARTREQLAKLANTDPLTKLRNRHGLLDELDRLHATSQRYGRGYCLALCDLDFFKSYNDSYGHQAGDEALRAVAATLAAHVRQGDTVFRYGGEEFLLLLPEQQQDDAVLALDRIRRAVQDLGLEHSTSYPDGVVTLSIGISAFTPGMHVTNREVLKEADRALYAAKAAGRNKVMPGTQPLAEQATA